MTKNQDIRDEITGAGIKYRQVAEEMGVTKQYLSKLLSKDLTPYQREKIMDACKMVKAKRSSKVVAYLLPEADLKELKERLRERLTEEGETYQDGVQACIRSFEYWCDGRNIDV